MPFVIALKQASATCHDAGARPLSGTVWHTSALDEGPTPRSGVYHMRLASRSIGRTAAYLPTGVLTYAFSKLLPGALILIATPLLIRAIDSDGFAIYSLAVGIVLVCANLSVGWLRQAALRFAGADDMEFSRVNPAAVAGSFLLVMLTSAAAAAVLLPERGAGVLIVVVTLAIAMTLQLLLLTLLQAGQHPRGVLISETLRGVAVLASAAVLVITNHTSVTSALLLTALASTVALLPAVRRRVLPHGADFVATRAWLRYGSVMSVWLTVSMTNTYADRFVLTSLVPLSDAGTYAATYEVVVRGFGMIFFPLTLASQAVIARLWNEENKIGALVLNRRIVCLQLALFVVAAPVAYLTSPRWLALLGGPFLAGQDLVLPLLFTAFTWQLSLSLHKWLELTGRTGTMLSCIVMATLVNVAATAALVPSYGITGAAYGALAASLAYCCATILLRCRGTHLSTKRAVGVR